MRLSEAIRLGAVMKPQGFGHWSAVSGADASCALGAALDAVSAFRGSNVAYLVAVEHFPILSARVKWPVEPIYPYSEPDMVVTDVIWVLNDCARWTREQIADWVEGVEREHGLIEQEQHETEVVNG